MSPSIRNYAERNLRRRSSANAIRVDHPFRTARKGDLHQRESSPWIAGLIRFRLAENRFQIPAQKAKGIRKCTAVSYSNSRGISRK
jgi:hypothetical protein